MHNVIKENPLTCNNDVKITRGYNKVQANLNSFTIFESYKTL